MENSGSFTYVDPKGARNYHHNFRYGYELSGRIDKKDPIFKDLGQEIIHKMIMTEWLIICIGM